MVIEQNFVYGQSLDGTVPDYSTTYRSNYQGLQHSDCLASEITKRVCAQCRPYRLVRSQDGHLFFIPKTDHHLAGKTQHEAILHSLQFATALNGSSSTINREEPFLKCDSVPNFLNNENSVSNSRDMSPTKWEQSTSEKNHEFQFGDCTQPENYNPLEDATERKTTQFEKFAKTEKWKSLATPKFSPNDKEHAKDDKHRTTSDLLRTDQCIVRTDSANDETADKNKNSQNKYFDEGTVRVHDSSLATNKDADIFVNSKLNCTDRTQSSNNMRDSAEQVNNDVSKMSSVCKESSVPKFYDKPACNFYTNQLCRKNDEPAELNKFFDIARKQPASWFAL